MLFCNLYWVWLYRSLTNASPYEGIQIRMLTHGCWTTPQQKCAELYSTQMFQLKICRTRIDHNMGLMGISKECYVCLFDYFYTIKPAQSWCLWSGAWLWWWKSLVINCYARPVLINLESWALDDDSHPTKSYHAQIPMTYGEDTVVFVHRQSFKNKNRLTHIFKWGDITSSTFWSLRIVF